jgi:hypothetical protein
MTVSILLLVAIGVILAAVAAIAVVAPGKAH